MASPLLIGAIALAICFRLFNPESPFGFGELVAYVQSIGNGLTFGGVGALVLAASFCLSS